MPLRSLRFGLAMCASALILAACTNKDADDKAAMMTDAMSRIQTAVETAQSTTGPGHPAMWTLADDDTTIYLFGTVHLLPEDLGWKTESFDAAFNAADKIYMEIDPDAMDAQSEMQAIIMEHGMFADGATLSSTLDAEDLATVTAAAEKVGVPMAALEPSKPWFTGLQLSLIQIMKSGYNPEAGVEKILTEEARANGKTFGSFESPLEQIQILSGAPMEDQIEGLVFTAKTIDMGKDMLDVIVAEWADGDVVGLGAMMGEPQMFGSRKAYDDLIVTRNANWIPQIEAILEEPGTKMIAVGAGHLSGPDSVIKMLEKKGYKVKAAN